MPPEENHRQDGEREEEEEAHEVTRFYTNPIAKPIPQTLEGSGHKAQGSVDDTIVALNMRAALRNGLEGSSEDASFQEDSLQEEWDKEAEPGLQLHPAGEAGRGSVSCRVLYSLTPSAFAFFYFSSTRVQILLFLPSAEILPAESMSI